MKFSAAGWFSDNWYENVDKAAEYGFGAIEQLDWESLDLGRASEALHRAGITSSALLLSSRDEAKRKRVGYNYGMVHEDAGEDIISAFEETAEAACTLNVPNIVVVTGLERSDVSREVQHKNCVETLKAIAPVAERMGVTVVLEPLNTIVDHAGYFLTTSAEAFEIIREVNSPAVRVLFDIYHQQITEGNLIRNITENIDLIGHFHMADNPGRDEPGTGEINYSAVLNAIAGTGYDRYLAFECGASVPIDELVPKMRALIAPFED